MKTLIVTLLLSFSGQSLASSYDNFKSICNLASTCNTFYITQTNVDAIFYELLSQEGFEEHEQDMYYIPGFSSMPHIDDVLWGRLELTQAIEFIVGHTREDFYGDILSELVANKIKSTLIQLHNTNVEYGFSAYGGGSACGVAWPALLIILPNEGRVLQVGLFGWHDC